MPPCSTSWSRRSRAPTATSSSSPTCGEGRAARPENPTSTRSSPRPRPAGSADRMAVVGIVVHHERARALALAREAVDWLTVQGHEARVPEDDVETLEASGLACTTTESFGKGLDLVV